MSRTSSPDRTRPPEPGQLRPLKLPDLVTFRLENGLRVWVAENHQLPEVSVRLVTEAGAVTDPAGREGVAELTGRLLSEGAGDRTAVEMARWLDRLGAGFSASVLYDAALLSLHTVSDVLEGALDFLRAAVREPAFSEEEVGRVRAELVDELRRERDEAGVVADHRLIDAVYGDHRYGMPSAGRPETVEALDRDDVADFHRRRYGPEDGFVVVCGDVEPEEARALLEERFGDWTGGAGRPDVPRPDGRRADGGRTVQLVDRPGSAQAEVRLGAVGLAYGDPDYYRAVVANAVLGGVFNSRINMNLREEKGWTYGARTTFHVRRTPGPFVGQAAVETPAAARALEEFLDEIRGMWESPPSQSEMELAKNALALSLPRQFETVSQVSRRVAKRIAFGLPDDYWERYRPRVEEVSRDGAVEATRRLLPPDDLHLVVVARADDVVDELEASFDRVSVRPADS